MYYTMTEYIEKNEAAFKYSFVTFFFHFFNWRGGWVMFNCFLHNRFWRIIKILRENSQQKYNCR
jgi:hypothetical protein